MRFAIDAVSDKVIADVVFAVIQIPAVYRATKYLSPNLTVRATRSHKYSGDDWQRSVILTIGRPNHAERAFIKKVKQAGEPFPVKKIQLKFK